MAFPLLIRKLVPVGLRGFIFAAIAGAVISSLASMLNSASAIFTMDIFTRHFRKDTSPGAQVLVGRIMTIAFVIVGCLIAPQLADPRLRGVFHFIQDFQGYVSPGVLACFLFGLFLNRTPPVAAVAGLVLNIPIYGMLHFEAFDRICFLNKMAVTFGVIVAVMGAITLVSPLKKPVVLPVREGFNTRPAASVVWLGMLIVIVVAGLYAVLW